MQKIILKVLDMMDIKKVLWILIFIGSPALSEEERQEPVETVERGSTHLVITGPPPFSDKTGKLLESHRSLIEIFPFQNRPLAPIYKEQEQPDHLLTTNEEEQKSFYSYQSMERIFHTDNNALFQQAMKKNIEKAMAWTDRIGNNLLHFAVVFKNLELAQFLVENGSPINKQNNLGYTPFHLSIINKNLELMQFFLDQPQTNLGIKNSFGDNAFHTVFLSLKEQQITSRSEILQLMLSEKYRSKMLPLINQPNTEGYLPIGFAFRDFDTLALKWIFANEEIENWTQEAKDGNSLLHIAVLSLSLESLKFILKRTHLDINAQNQDGNTPLHLVVEILNDNPTLQVAQDILAFLLNRNAVNFNLRNEDGKTAKDITQKHEIREEILNAQHTQKLQQMRTNKKKSSRRSRYSKTIGDATIGHHPDVISRDKPSSGITPCHSVLMNGKKSLK